MAQIYVAPWRNREEQGKLGPDMGEAIRLWPVSLTVALALVVWLIMGLVSLGILPPVSVPAPKP